MSSKDFLKRQASPSKVNPPKFPRTEESNNQQKSYGRLPLKTEESVNSSLFFGLPCQVLQLLTKVRGIEKLYDWQKECLELDAVSEGTNLIYSLPTSGGKTLVAEILIMKQLLCGKKNCILVLPFVSLVQQKVRDLSPFAVDLGFMIEEYAGSKGKFPPIKRRRQRSIYISTIEKATSLINVLIELKRLDEIGLVVVDELHMLYDGSQRGATLEIMLSKLQYVDKNIQIVGMSATIDNIKDLKTFLSADVYSRDFRPVQLEEFIKVEKEIWLFRGGDDPKDRFVMKRKLCIPNADEIMKKDPDLVAPLVDEIIPLNSCLVFCPTRKSCESIATSICKYLNKQIIQHRLDEKKSLFAALSIEGDGKVCNTLRYTIGYGIAYHHAGMTTDERRILEEAYSNGVLCCICCTSTLAAGVNLPAKRVIIFSPIVGKDFITRSRYKQMSGRAGRAGIDTSGESIIMIKPEQKQKIMDMLLSPLEVCKSSLLHGDGEIIRKLLLTLIGLQLVKSEEEILNFMQITLFGIQCQDPKATCRDLIEKTIVELETKLLIKVVQNSENLAENNLVATNLGIASYKSGLNLQVVHKLYKDISSASKSLNVQNSLHLLYLLTPYEFTSTIQMDYFIFSSAFSALEEHEQVVGNLFGINEPFLSMIPYGRNVGSVDLSVAHRFFITLILYDLLKEKSIWDVERKFNIHRGIINSLQLSAVSFANSVHRFCEHFPEFWAYQLIIGPFKEKLSNCLSADLIPLMELPAVKKGRAKMLYTAGYKSLVDIANANVEEMSRKIEFIPKKVARKIISSAKMLLIQQANDLIEESEEISSAINKAN